MTRVFRYIPTTLTAILFSLPVWAAEELPNPLGITSPDLLIARIIKTFLGIVGAIALLYFVWGGFLLLTSAGNPEKTKKGRDTIFWAILGLVIIFGSYGITEAVFRVLSGQPIT